MEKRGFPGIQILGLFCRMCGHWECFGDWQWKSQAAPEEEQQPKETAGRKVFWDCVPWRAWRGPPTGEFMGVKKDVTYLPVLTDGSSNWTFKLGEHKVHKSFIT